MCAKLLFPLIPMQACPTSLGNMTKRLNKLPPWLPTMPSLAWSISWAAAAAPPPNISPKLSRWRHPLPRANCQTTSQLADCRDSKRSTSPVTACLSMSVNVPMSQAQRNFCVSSKTKNTPKRWTWLVTKSKAAPKSLISTWMRPC